MAFAMENSWPLIVVAGSTATEREAMGGFQEMAQVEAVRMFTKFAARPSSISRIPFYVEKAIRTSTYGRPGAVYIDMTADLTTQTVQENIVRYLPRCPPPPPVFSDPVNIRKAVALMATAKKPLVVIGKGAAYARADQDLQQFIETTRFPFLPTHMAKGILPDTHPLCVYNARITALKEADLIILFGARLNWKLYFGLPPECRENVKTIQVDICLEEIGNNVMPAVPLPGDVTSVTRQLNEELQRQPQPLKPNEHWLKMLRDKVEETTQHIQELSSNDTIPLHYYAAFSEVQNAIPADSLIVNEGATTMDVGFTMLYNALPRHRLESGVQATMGVGVGFALAAALYCRDYHPGKRVVCVEGDSAFGFSGMEIETLARYHLPMVIVIINNNGIKYGISQEHFERTKSGDPALTVPSTALLPNARYEKMAEAFGGKGYFAVTKEEVREAMAAAIKDTTHVSIVNIMVDPENIIKPLEAFWLFKSAPIMS